MALCLDKIAFVCLISYKNNTKNKNSNLKASLISSHGLLGYFYISYAIGGTVLVFWTNLQFVG